MNEIFIEFEEGKVPFESLMMLQIFERGFRLFLSFSIIN